MKKGYLFYLLLYVVPTPLGTQVRVVQESDQEKNYINNISAAKKEQDEANEPKKVEKIDQWEEASLSKSELPDEEVIDLNLSAIDKKETELQQQIHTGSYSGEDLSKISDIYIKSNDDKTKIVALEAIGRSSDTENSQRILIKLYKDTSELHEKVKILGFIRSDGEGGPVDSFLKEIISQLSENNQLRKMALIELVTARKLNKESLSKLNIPEDLMEEINAIKKYL